MPIIINISTEPMISFSVFDLVLLISFQRSFIDKPVFWGTLKILAVQN